MSEKPKKKQTGWKQSIGNVLLILVCVAWCYFLMRYVYRPDVEAPLHERLLSLVGLLLEIYVAILVQLVIHEAGHLVFGLFTGYTFSSFRIFSFMWLKEGGKIRFRRLSVVGTSGQCLMVPPDMADGRFPVILYNLGGSIMNVIAGTVCLGLFLAFADVPFLSTMMLLLTVTGFMLAIMNGVPMRLNSVNNDGYNAFALTRNREAMHSFWVQLKVNGEIAHGVRLRDMPDEWFIVPSDEAMKNSMVAVMGVFASNRLMDAARFEEADKLMAHMLETDSGMVGLHRNLMICDRMYIEMITENRKEVLDGMLDEEQKRFMKSMKRFPSVLRTEYVYALFGEKDTAKADTVKAQFEKCAKTYPYQNDIQSERELMELAETVYASKQRTLYDLERNGSI